METFLQKCFDLSRTEFSIRNFLNQFYSSFLWGVFCYTTTSFTKSYSNSLFLGCLQEKWFLSPMCMDCSSAGPLGSLVCLTHTNVQVVEVLAAAHTLLGEMGVMLLRFRSLTLSLIFTENHLKNMWQQNQTLQRLWLYLQNVVHVLNTSAKKLSVWI